MTLKIRIYIGFLVMFFFGNLSAQTCYKLNPPNFSYDTIRLDGTKIRETDHKTIWLINECKETLIITNYHWATNGCEFKFSKWQIEPSDSALLTNFCELYFDRERNFNNNVILNTNFGEIKIPVLYSTKFIPSTGFGSESIRLNYNHFPHISLSDREEIIQIEIENLTEKKTVLNHFCTSNPLLQVENTSLELGGHCKITLNAKLTSPKTYEQKEITQIIELYFTSENGETSESIKVNLVAEFELY